MKIFLIISCLFVILGCSPQDRNYIDHESPLIIQAAQRGNIEEVKQLLAADKSALTITDSNGNSAAQWAILDNHPEIAIYLIEQGYPINPSSDTDFPLIMSCLSRYTSESEAMLKYLLEHGADPNIRYAPEGWIPLNMAVNNRMENKVRLLVKHGAALDSKDEYGLTSLEAAKKRVAEFKDPNFNYPHGELSDPKVRQDHIERSQSMVKLLIELKDGK